MFSDFKGVINYILHEFPMQTTIARTHVSINGKYILDIRKL